jgi:hypothetical protein
MHWRTVEYVQTHACVRARERPFYANPYCATRGLTEGKKWIWK